MTRAGLFILVPFELGPERQYLGNPYVVARELMRGKPYFISHASAMDLHGMLTRPQLALYVTSSTAARGRTVLGTEFRMVRRKPSHAFGTAEHWVDKQEEVVVSDVERTVLDGLKQPEYCGGFTEVAKGFWMPRDEIAVRRLVDYALHLRVGAVVRRLGYLLEAYGIEAPDQPSEGRFMARWKLRLM